MIVIVVSAAPCTGEIEVTVPIEHGVNRNCRGLAVGTVCEHAVALSTEPHEATGTAATYDREYCLLL